MNFRSKLLLALSLSAGLFLGGVLIASAIGPAFPYATGGTGSSTVPAQGQVFYAGATAWQSEATTTASCSSGASCTPFTILGSSPITITGSAGNAFPFSPLTNFGVNTSATTTPLWLETPSSGTISLMASSTSYFDRLVIGTSTPQTQIWGATATSSFASGINLTNGGCLAYNGVCLTAGIISGGASQAVNYATTAGLPAYAYLNGTGGVGATITEVSNAALSVDGANPSVGQRVLVKNESGSCTSSSGTCINGLYTVTAAGSGIAVFVLTRAPDYDQSIDVTPGISTYVLSGTTNGDTTWALTSAAPITIGVTGLTYAQLANGNITIPVSVTNGGTGQQTFTSSQLLYGNGTNALSSVGTSSVTCNNGITCTFNAVGTVGTVPGLSTINAGVLGAVVNGATPTSQATSTLYGTGVYGQVLMVTTVPTWTATSTLYTYGPGLTQSNGLQKQIENRGFTMLATTTSIQGTTTIPLEVGYGELWNTGKCSVAPLGATMNVDFYFHNGAATTHLTYINASSTVGTIIFNSTITSGATTSVDIGTPANSPVSIQCTINDTI